MDKDNSYLSLASIGGALMEQQVTNKILSCNQDTAVYGLVLTQEQAGCPRTYSDKCLKGYETD